MKFFLRVSIDIAGVLNTESTKKFARFGCTNLNLGKILKNKQKEGLSGARYRVVGFEIKNKRKMKKMKKSLRNKKLLQWL